MKRAVPLFTCLLLLLGLVGGNAAQAEQKIGTIDLKKVFDEYWKAKEAFAALEEEANTQQKELKSLDDSRTKAIDAYRTALESANDQAVSNEERERRKKTAENKVTEINELEQQIVQTRRQAEATLQYKRQTTIEKLFEEIKRVIDAKAKAGGFSLIMDSSARGITGTQMLLFSNGEFDLTSAVLAQLNESARPTIRDAESKKNR